MIKKVTKEGNLIRKLLTEIMNQVSRRVTPTLAQRKYASFRHFSSGLTFQTPLILYTISGPSTGENGPTSWLTEQSGNITHYSISNFTCIWVYIWNRMGKTGCGQRTSDCVHILTNYYQCALEQGCLSHPSVLPPPFIPLFPTPPPSFHPILWPPCGSSIYQPPWFSLYLALGGTAAYIKYLETDGLVQQPGNLSTVCVWEREREREREKERGSLSLLSFSFSLPLQGGESPEEPDG